MKIRHRDYGEVEGVEPVTENWEPTPVAWFKDGAHYPRKYGWSEVTEPKYVDVTGDVVIDGDGDLVFNCEHFVVAPFAHRFLKKQWFDMPENLLHEIHHLTAKGFIEFIQRFKKPCLIVEKEEG